MSKYLLRAGIILLLPLLLIIINLSYSAEASTADLSLLDTGATFNSALSTPSWLEPRGISIVEMVGKVPESVLQDLIIVYEVGRGIVTYKSGTRVGNRVTIHAEVDYSVRSTVPCLGMFGHVVLIWIGLKYSDMKFEACQTIFRYIGIISV